jgi:periplasmic protein TonB
MYASPKRSTLISALVHVAVLAILLLTGGVLPTPSWEPEHVQLVLPSDLVQYEVTRIEHGGGGGGLKEKLPPQKGDPPKPSTHPFVPPTARIENMAPVLSMDQAILADPSAALPHNLIGDPNGVIGVISAGPGTNGGIGTGDHGGVGPRKGEGAGPDGDDRGLSGNAGFRERITDPVLLWKTEPEYTDEARKAKLQGSVFLRVVVNERGQAESITVTQGLGLGLDDRAIDAVAKWKFRPAMRAGKPVPTVAIIQVTFRLL